MQRLSVVLHTAVAWQTVNELACGDSGIVHGAKRPNILCFLFDDYDGVNMSVYPGGLAAGSQPNLERGDMAPLAIALSAVVKAMPNQFNVPLEHDRSNIGALLADAGYATGFTGKFHVGPLWTQEQLLEYSSANHSDRLGMSNLFCRNELTAREIIRRTYGFTWAKHVYDQNMRQPFAEHNPDWTLAAAHEFLEAHQQQAFYLHVCTTLMHGTPGSWARALDFPAVSGEGLLGESTLPRRYNVTPLGTYGPIYSLL
ncbi:hypothetical protein EMIHUDRAFT_222457 [Emiliania huxleyi CCMP1516]|uniref:Sulfatase N-terminal domain-containing protein n=2 Tax=Emiliania huxleyi TaxID=2903 RepID=A0A0D3KY73_EMIH1|nr:hypothetical protein EMIHUDRAFT_222457 [Emiliania huxleyi CCMP1516]EOD40708.1 hypothetical protein EMIHUDRAFT_222457 [Emiliania huxleyi CCMP1516]|eukprot:XP_005793137.1 hypothetical protein EMIHUDRAFT_222457 [Emiliania huxleyi CCMP1516]